jgi:hypothetical protein
MTTGTAPRALAQLADPEIVDDLAASFRDLIFSERSRTLIRRIVEIACSDEDWETRNTAVEEAVAEAERR